VAKKMHNINMLGNDRTLADMERLVAGWVDSQYGRRQLTAIERAARAAADGVIDDARVDPAQLRQPVTL
jgi:hypothetical protein